MTLSALRTVALRHIYLIPESDILLNVFFIIPSAGGPILQRPTAQAGPHNSQKKHNKISQMRGRDAPDCKYRVQEILDLYRKAATFFVHN